MALVFKGLVYVLLSAMSIDFLLAENSQEINSTPNILFILVDDLGWSDVGFMGSTAYETPNVDQFASEGMVLTNFYSGGPVCSPTRASILTGKSTARTGVTTFLVTPEKDAAHVSHQLPLSEFTIAEAFKKNGYTTGIFGKWHLGYEAEHWAANQGFDVAIGGTTSQNAWRLLHPGKLPPLNQNEVAYFSPHHLTHMDNGPAGEYLTDRLANETINFIKNNKDKPFFAFLSLHTVHTPLEAEDVFVQKYRKKFEQLESFGNDDLEYGSKKFQNLPKYAAMIQHMDENVGKILSEVDALGLAENTIVVFTSDNGGKHSITSNAPLRGAKHNLYEGGIRVPTAIRYPGKIQAGTSTNIPLISDDFYPTLLQMAGLPLENQQHLDGLSFIDVVYGGSEKYVHKALYWHYPHKRKEGAVRWKNYKLIYEYSTGKVELYNLDSDIGERKNRAIEQPKIANKLKKMLAKWLVETNAQFPDESIVMPN